MKGWPADAFLRARKSCFEAVRAEGLEEVVDGVDFKGADRVVVMRGDEDDGGAGADQFQNFEAIELRHLDIEKNEIGFQFGDGFHGFEAIRTFGGDFDFGMCGDEFAQHLPGEFLVIDDDGTNFPFARRHHDARASRSAGNVIATQ